MQIINWNICCPFFNVYINTILPDTTIFPSDSFFWSFQKNDLGISPPPPPFMLYAPPTSLSLLRLRKWDWIFLSLISQGCQCRKFLKSKNEEKRESYFIHNKAHVQNGVYDNYVNSFLVSKELYFVTV